ncbi:hypothetical protein [Lacisediminimonas sp.]|uniref:hypothetical protein n=1 Tax=Lacisediminimonas sp. TaxID=3060582 RepID=UPI0027268947|nr:hypothetical protein [Lacisediminimonas sp.]MDO8298859.1 hypothetical protein [Lacisediminimonas sp.]
MKSRLIKMSGIASLCLAAAGVWAAGAVSMNVPGSTDAAGRRVLTFIAKDPPGVRCNGNLQVAAELANTYRVPIQLIPSSLAPDLPAPSVFYGNQMLAADGRDHNGAVSFQMVSDVLDVEDVPRQAKEGLLFNNNVRRNLDGLKDSIRSGGK